MEPVGQTDYHRTKQPGRERRAYSYLRECPLSLQLVLGRDFTRYLLSNISWRNRRSAWSQWFWQNDAGQAGARPAAAHQRLGTALWRGYAQTERCAIGGAYRLCFPESERHALCSYGTQRGKLWSGEPALPRRTPENRGKTGRGGPERRGI